MPIELGGRAFDLLCVLVQCKGAVVSKAEIQRAVWPSMAVEESNIRFQIAALRKALGEHATLIKTIHGRGYLFADEGPQSYAAT